MIVKYQTLDNNKLRKSLSRLGVESTTLGDEAFPGVVLPEYFEVWQSFIKAQVAKDLYAQGLNKTHSIYLVALGFMSYLENISSSPYHDNRSVFDTSNGDYYTNARLKGMEVKQALKSLGLLENLSPSRILVDCDFESNDFINAVVGNKIRVQLSLIPSRKYVNTPRGNVSGRKEESLDRIIAKLKNYLYPNKWPTELKKASRKLGPKRSSDKTIMLERLLVSPSNAWYRPRQRGDFTLLVRRARHDILVVRLEWADSSMRFLGSENVKNFKQKATKKIESIILEGVLK